MKKQFKVYFNVTGNIKDHEKEIPGLKDTMCNELIRAYNIYVEKSNSVVTDLLNSEFEKLYPDYFKNNKGRGWTELTDYNRYMAYGYQRLIVDDFNKQNISPLLNFFVDPEDVTFKGYLKADKNIVIDFYTRAAF